MSSLSWQMATANGVSPKEVTGAASRKPGMIPFTIIKIIIQSQLTTDIHTLLSNEVLHNL